MALFCVSAAKVQGCLTYVNPTLHRAERTPDFLVEIHFFFQQPFGQIEVFRPGGDHEFRLPHFIVLI